MSDRLTGDCFMALNNIISKGKIQKLHQEFERLKSNKFLQRCIFYRIFFNRVIQSTIIILSYPIIWRHVINGFLRTIQGKGSLRSLELAITYRCNSACDQCSCRLAFNKDRELKERLTTDEFKNAVDQAVELGAFQFSINGGEPMLEEETVYELVEYIKKHHRRLIMLCTNGTLLTERKIAKLKECGLDGIEMGFDSAFEDLHDKNRVKGSYKKILDNIQHCKKHRIHVSLNTILTNDKVQKDDIIYTFHLAKKLGCLLQITPCCLTGAHKNRIDLMLTEETKLYFFWLLSKSWNNRTDMYSSLTVIKCPAAKEKIGLQPYGDVVSCPLIQITYGNIRENSLKNIQAEMLKNKYYNSTVKEGCLPAMSESFIKEYLLDK